MRGDDTVLLLLFLVIYQVLTAGYGHGSRLTRRARLVSSEFEVYFDTSMTWLRICAPV
jgi:hypothetical protein